LYWQPAAERIPNGVFAPAEAACEMEYVAKVFDFPVLWRVRPIIQSRLESIPESALVALNEPSQIRCARVSAIDKSHDPPLCTLTGRTTILLPRILANCITLGDEIVFPLPIGDAAGPEVLVAKSVSKIGHCLYLAPIGHVSQPKVDKRNQQFVSAEVLWRTRRQLGLSPLLGVARLLLSSAAR
jgi:hypothetical protein